MDERKRYGILTALGKAIGDAAKEDPDVLKALRGVTDVDDFEAFLVQHRGGVPEALAQAFARETDPAQLPKDRAKLVLQAKLTMSGGAPVTGRDAERGPVTGR